MHDEDKENLKKWVQFFKNFSYKPNFAFAVESNIGLDRLYPKVRITMMVPDSRIPLPENEHVHALNVTGVRKNIPLIPIMLDVSLGPYHSDEYALEFMRFNIREMEDHEIDEWIRFKGELVNDPHKEK
jgi:hypothetical protein